MESLQGHGVPARMESGVLGRGWSRTPGLYGSLESSSWHEVGLPPKKGGLHQMLFYYLKHGLHPLV
jgi:hypothetical protein